MNWPELIATAEAMSAQLSDHIVTAKKVHAQVVGENGPLVLAEAKRSFHLTPLAMRQVCRKLRIPEEYFMRLPPEIQATNLNHAMQTAKGKWLLRNVKNTTHGVLTPRYSPFGHAQVLAAVAEALGDTAVTIRQYHMDHELLCLVITLDDYEETLGKTMDGKPDKHWPGLYIVNSEVGLRRVSVCLGIWRLVCSNGLVRSDGQFNVVSRVHQNILPEDLSATITEEVDEALEVAPLVMGALAEAKRIPVPNPLKIIDKIGKRHRMESEQIGQVKAEFERENDHTHFGIIQAFTAAARRLSPNDRLEMEELAGKLLDPEQVPGLARKRIVTTDSAENGPNRPTVLKYTSSLLSTAFTPDGRRAFVGEASGTIRVLDTETGLEVHAWTAHSEAILAIAVLPDNRHLLTAGADQTVRVWDWHSGVFLHACECPEGSVCSIAVMPDGSRAMLGSTNGIVVVQNIWSGEVEAGWAVSDDGFQVNAVCLIPETHLVLTGSDDGHVRLWDARTGILAKDFGQMMHQVFSLSASWDGRRALVGGLGNSTESSALMLGLISGRVLQRYDVPSDLTSTVLFLHDRRRILTAGGMMGDDCSVRIWDMRTGHELHRLDLHEDDIHEVALSPGGDKCLSVGADGTAAIWPLPA